MPETCAICNRIVTKQPHGGRVQCTLCKSVYHGIKCLKLTGDQVKSINSSHNWLCLHCKMVSSPIGEFSGEVEKLSLSDIFNNIKFARAELNCAQNSIEKIHQDVKSLHKKINFLIKEVQPCGESTIGIIAANPDVDDSTVQCLWQPSLGTTSQPYGMSAIPSPPTVLFSSTQQIPTQTGLYGPFQIDQSQVLGTQGRSQYSQYPNPYGLGQTASSPYSAQSMYLQTQQHPPPSAQPPPDIYQNINSYRLPASGPFAQSQQLSNNQQTTVLISSSSSNSLMSASVKPSSQPISAIGTKTGNVGQAYQQQSQQGQQLYMYDPTMQGNYMTNTGVMQRGPTGPVQSSVVPGMQPSSSYYSGSTGGQTGYFQNPGNSTLQSAPIHQHQTGFGLQGNVFNTHNQSHSNASLQSFGSQFLSSPMQMAAAAALTAQQQYRSPNPPYMKGVGSGSGQHMGDQSGRAQQLKSPGSQQQQQDVLSSVFNSGPQIPSPKSRQNCKQPQPQPSPTQHKYSSYPGVGNQQSGQIAQRYPTPIQRPVNFQPQVGSMQNQNQNVNNQRHRPTHNQNNRGPSRQYFGGQGSGMQSSQIDKADESKIGESATPANGSSTSASSSASPATKAISTSGGAAPPEAKEAKEESAAGAASKD